MFLRGVDTPTHYGVCDDITDFKVCGFTKKNFSNKKFIHLILRAIVWQK